MRATDLLQIGILALPTFATNSYVFIYVADNLKSDVLVDGQLRANEAPNQMSYTSDQHDKCLNKTETGLIYFESPKCKDQPIYAYIATVSLKSVDNEPQHLNISMPKYNLSVCYKTHPWQFLS